MPIQIIDLFAGPGGLGEGFSSLDDGEAFKIAVSAEMETSAHSTLRLRSYFREVRHNTRDARSYYRFCNKGGDFPFDGSTRSAWRAAEEEARQLTLGVPSDNQELDDLLSSRIRHTEDCVLIGGPPCQAYSLVGRSRNAGKADYRAEHDHRHFLYREYLRIIQARRPAVFVMENVKGILSSKVGGKRIFHEILKDLCDPDAALGKGNSGTRYKIHSLVKLTHYEKGMDADSIDPTDFIVRADEHGVPQARHRVILLGIRNDIASGFDRLGKEPALFVSHALAGLPDLRSRVSKEQDSGAIWAALVLQHFGELAKDASANGLHELSDALWHEATAIRRDLPSGALRLGKAGPQLPLAKILKKWYEDRNLEVWLNHEARSHMSSDLRRYAFSATYAKLNKISPKGHEQFMLEGLRPNHENWESGKFADRFRVQRFGAPATTVTSHIAKDGHYFIHPDPTQCRSLTVREAARIQTFPDNYFFQGNRTQQFHQVGNAVPPLLALRVAQIVKQILRGKTEIDAA
jgi:DNA (cytosine-5)-methyltransferase 1